MPSFHGSVTQLLWTTGIGGGDRNLEPEYEERGNYVVGRRVAGRVMEGNMGQKRFYLGKEFVPLQGQVEA